jgi:hypothetical protein
MTGAPLAATLRLYEHVPALRRWRLHRQVAEALTELPAPDPDAVAYHFQQAGDERAAIWLVRAVALVWAIGLYAIVFGAALVGLGLRLHGWGRQLSSAAM